MAPDGWSSIKLGDFVTLQRGHDLTETQRKPGSVPVMGSAGVTGYHDTAKAKGPGVTIGRSGVGSIGVVNYSPTDYWPHNTVLYVTDFHGNDARFAYYLLKSINFRGYDSGSAQASLNRNYIYPIPVSAPYLTIQRRIADILGTLDDKIELNRRINRTLEAMAQALFKHWFVDFGPFLDGEFVESELGLVPEGWRVGSLGEIARNERVSVDPQEIAGDTPYIGLADMPQGSITLDTWGVADESISGKSLMKRGQVLFGKLRPYFKKVGVAPVDGVCSTDILIIVPKLPAYYSLALCQLMQDEFIDYTTAVSDGTRMPRVSWQMMAKYPMVLPGIAVIERFNQMVEPWTQIIINNVFENRALSITRDYLLPRLLSGEIPVEVAEDVVADAG